MTLNWVRGGMRERGGEVARMRRMGEREALVRFDRAQRQISRGGEVNEKPP